MKLINRISQISLYYHKGTTVLSKNLAQFNCTFRTLNFTVSSHHPFYLVSKHRVSDMFRQNKSTLCCDFAHLVSQECLSGMLGCSLSSSAFHPPRWLAAQGYCQSDLNIQYITVKTHQSMVLHPIQLRAFLTVYFNNNPLLIIMKPIIIKSL